MYDATKDKYPDITFDRINVDENKDLTHQLGVKSIPHLVFIDKTGTVIFSGDAPMNRSYFEEMISNYR